MNMNDLSSALVDLYDIRNALPEEVKNLPKDNEGTEITIGDCLDDAIEFLESLEAGTVGDGKTKTQHTLIVGDAATYEEDGETRVEFQRIDFIKSCTSFEEAQAQGEHAITDGGYDTYVITQNFGNDISFN